MFTALLAFHCLSLAFHCLFPASPPDLFTALDLSLPFVDLFTAFLDLFNNA